MLDKILEYQKVDGELAALENEIAKSKDKELAGEIQNELKNQHSRLLSLESNAKKANESYIQASKKYEEFKQKLAELEKQLESADPSKLSVYEKAYKDFTNISNALEKEITAIYATVQQINKEYEEIIRKSKTDREKFDKYRAAYSKLKAEKEPKIAELKIKLATMSKQIDSSLMQMYKQKSEACKYPYFVALNLNKCGGCRMEISASKIADINKQKFQLVECESCGRYNYKK